MLTEAVLLGSAASFANSSSLTIAEDSIGFLFPLSSRCGLGCFLFVCMLVLTPEGFTTMVYPGLLGPMA